MSHSCDQHRFEMLESHAAIERSDVHCEACQAWETRQMRLVDALHGLSHLRAPETLAERCRVELAICSVGRLAAPSELEARVEQSIRDVAAEHPLERSLRGLGVVRAPDVLERLVAEELASPEGAQAKRFAGDLPSVPAPEDLERSLELSPEVRPARRLKLVSGAIASAAAAVLALVILQPEREVRARSYKFDVVDATHTSELSPYAISLMGAATGGLSVAVSDAEGRLEQDG